MKAEVVVVGAAALSPFGLNLKETVRGLNGETPGRFEKSSELGAYVGATAEVAMIPAYDAREMLATRSVSAFDKLTRHLCVAVDQLHGDIGFADLANRRKVVADEKVSLVIGSTGSIQSVVDIDLQAIREPQYVQPGLFPNGVFNVPASYAAIRRAIKGSCITFTDGDVSSHVALATALRQLRSGRIKLAVAGGVEELTPSNVLHQAAQAAIRGAALPPLSESAVLFALESREDAERRGQRPLATLMGVSQLYQKPGAGPHAALSDLKRQLGASSEGIDWVYAEDPVALDVPGIARHRRRLAPKVGHVGAAYGAVGLLAGLADPEIAPGQRVLVLSVDPNGACGALLFRKEVNVG